MKKTIFISIGLLFLIFILIYSLYNPEEIELTDEVRRTLPGSFIELSEGVVHYEIDGPIDGQPVILVHGFSVPYYIWDPTFEALVNEGYRVVKFDLYGRGFSDRPDLRYNAGLFDRQILDLIDGLEIDRPVDIFGLSMGGAVSVYFAANHPEKVRKLVLVDPSFPVGSGSSIEDLPAVGEFLTRTTYFPDMAESQLGDFYQPEKFPDWPDRFRVQMKYKGFQKAILSTIRNFFRGDFTEYYEKIGELGTETLLIYGTEDKTISSSTIEKIREKIPQT
ncbi:MAG: alpha/beta hydrolase, partial [bacterium]|nr:alpha/beta hydrolase [bacterium]